MDLMQRPAIELVRLIPFDKADSYRRRGWKVSPHDRGAHRKYGVIASKPVKPKKRTRK
jgi:hypothetical protein